MQRAAEVTVRPAATSARIARASLGDQAAWDQLVERYGGTVWSVARAHGPPRTQPTSARSPGCC
jgi:hypothetical protein